MSNPTLNIDSSHLDRFCKATLTTLRDAGMDKADTPYIIDAAIVSAGDFNHLLRNGAVSVPGSGPDSWKSVLRKYVTPRSGPDAGKIGFNLNFDLT